MKNLFEGIPSEFPEEVIETIAEGGSLRIERIISKGHSSPEGFWYDQDQLEWVVLLKGAARLRFEDDRVVEMKAGDYINIPAHEKHRVDWTLPKEETIWLGVFYSE